MMGETPATDIEVEIRRTEKSVSEMRRGMLPYMFFGWLIGVAVGQLIGVAQGMDLYWHLQGFCNQLEVFFIVMLGFLLVGEVILKICKRKLRKELGRA